MSFNVQELRMGKSHYLESPVYKSTARCQAYTKPGEQNVDQSDSTLDQTFDFPSSVFFLSRHGPSVLAHCWPGKGEVTRNFIDAGFYPTLPAFNRAQVLNRKNNVCH